MKRKTLANAYLGLMAIIFILMIIIPSITAKIILAIVEGLLLGLPYMLL